jgi:transposase
MMAGREELERITVGNCYVTYCPLYIYVVQEASAYNVQVAYVDAGYTGEHAAEAAEGQGIRLQMIKLPGAKRGFILLPRRWLVERSVAWTTRFRRLSRDYERLPVTLAGLHHVAFVILS